MTDASYLIKNCLIPIGTVSNAPTGTFMETLESNVPTRKTFLVLNIGTKPFVCQPLTFMKRSE